MTTQDPLETRLAQLPLRQAPPQWRESILNHAKDARPCEMPSANILALAAAWIVIGLLQWSAHSPSRPTSDEPNAPVCLPVLDVARSAECYLEELLSEPEAAPLVPRQSSLIRKPIAFRA